jgi:hypothetical protein
MSKPYAVILFLFLLVAVPTSLATPVTFGGTFTYTEVSGGSGNSADRFQFAFTTDGLGVLRIIGLDVALAGTLFYDLESGAPGYSTYGAYSALDGGTGYSADVVPPISSGPGGDKVANFTFTDFTVGETFAFRGDVDFPPSGLLETLACVLTGLPCDHVTGNRFVARGPISYTITLGTVPGYAIAGPNSFTFPDSGWYDLVNTAAGVSGSRARNDFRGTVQVVPEPTAFLLVGAGLLGLALAAKRARARS